MLTRLPLVLAIAQDEEIIPSPCAFGTIVKGHACYCGHEDGPRKCPKWSRAEPYHTCVLYKPNLDLPQPPGTTHDTPDHA